MDQNSLYRSGPTAEFDVLTATRMWLMIRKGVAVKGKASPMWEAMLLVDKYGKTKFDWGEDVQKQ
eukprot:3720341-Rhodomonas_salina.1